MPSLQQKIDALIATHNTNIENYEDRKQKLDARRIKDEEGIHDYERMIEEEREKITMLEKIKTYGPEYVELLKELFK